MTYYNEAVVDRSKWVFYGSDATGMFFAVLDCLKHPDLPKEYKNQWPKSMVVSKGNGVRFSFEDSLAIEARFKYEAIHIWQLKDRDDGPEEREPDWEFGYSSKTRKVRIRHRKKR